MNKKEAQFLARAITIAAGVHENQLDKAGAPYILHPLRMMGRTEDIEEQIVAVLHDVVEDSREPDRWTPERLIEEGFSKKIAAAVDALTHRTMEAHGVEESYDEFIARVLQNDLAIRVKFLDLEDNMNLTRLTRLTREDLERVEKYHRAHRQLLEVLSRARGKKPKREPPPPPTGGAGGGG